MDFKKRNIVIALMVAMFLGAVEGTVVTTAMPTIARDLNGFELISWIFSLYLLTSAISTPIYGKLADLYGRKNMLSLGIFIFLVGSSLCGISGNMLQLMVFRCVQGLGAGAILTITYTIVGDIFTLSERAKVQGWISSVWGISSLIGPFLGGFLIDTLSWHWIFFINLPFGILSIILIQRYLDESFKKKKHPIDYAGAFTLSAAIIALLYSFVSTGENKGSFMISMAISLSAAFILFVIFYIIESKAEEPIIPFDTFTKTNALINTVSFLLSAVLMGFDVYLPIYIQTVLGYGPTISGLCLAPMSISWLLSSVILGDVIPKYGAKKVITVSGIVVLLSCILLLTLNAESSLIAIIVYSFFSGFGFGGALATLTIVIQSSVGYEKRGAVTASNSLLRTIGQTIGVSIYGGLLNFNMQYSSSAMPGIHIVFISFVILSAVSLLTSVMLLTYPKTQILPHN
ncbi:MDR family MFS transporter [Oxobacter pfennigii]|nr:MDR family MFS transporter [Oxobacter pfennigii]